MAWVIYFIGMADDVKAGLLTTSVLVLIVFVVDTIFATLEDGEPLIAKKWTVVFPLLGILLGGLLPSSKTVAAMYVIPKIMDDKALGDDVGKVRDLARKWIDEKTKE